ncbi:hypothetical protein LOOC260_108490 [Paucilactobacillus hokkaidonensis JCM 18461]|uniref:DUF4097 domain-containing protein n=2 Tax=Paucilactobacillus hokkaidonensis TaxID=1193095 RepID=A0A0A1GWJ5_9LACO|nr:DUF4097 family beta strand repeat-containing protein [Paucilactobacillus hokkaidonensis]KRO10100.1 hypothetical protein IV59_GL002121 [Paucilactobacillus hokkaidonensis]BAP85389.1 hypothetical protein LOOC260_108490 [Paucilactobacillus hokkaidonensis JCM 18461]
MKKTIIIGAVMTAIGLFATLIGLASGASTDLVWQNGVKIDKAYHSTNQLKQFKNLTLNTNNYDVTVQTGTRFQVEITGSKLSKPVITQDGDNLTISNKDFDPVNIGFGRVSPKLIITVPTDTQLETIKGNLATSDLTINTLQVKQAQLELDNGSLDAHNLTISDSGRLALNNGDAEIKNSNLSNVSLKMKNGATEFDNNTLTNGSYESSNGSQEFDDVTFKSVVNVKNRNGKIEMDSPITDGYQLSSANGKIQLFDRQTSHQLNENETAANRIVANTRNGKIEIDD